MRSYARIIKLYIYDWLLQIKNMYNRRWNLH